MKIKKSQPEADQPRAEKNKISITTCFAFLIMSLALFISPNFVFSENNSWFHSGDSPVEPKCRFAVGSSLPTGASCDFRKFSRFTKGSTQSMEPTDANSSNHPIPFTKTAQASTEAYASSKPSFLNTISNKLTSTYNSLKRDVKTIYNYTLNIAGSIVPTGSPAGWTGLWNQDVDRNKAPQGSATMEPAFDNTETDNNELIPEEDQPSYDSTLPIEDESEDESSSPRPNPLPEREGAPSQNEVASIIEPADSDNTWNDKRNEMEFVNNEEEITHFASLRVSFQNSIANLQNKIAELEQAILNKEVITITLKGEKGDKGNTGSQGPPGTGNVTTVPSYPVNTNTWGGANVFSGYGSFESLGVSYDLSAGRSLGVGGSTSLGSDSTDTLTVNSSSAFNSPITLSNASTLTTGTGQVTFGGNVDVSNGLDITAGDLTVGSNFTVDPTTGNITANDISVQGSLTVSGAQTYSGAASFTADSTSSALTVSQQGTGNIVSFQDNGTDSFVIDTNGNITTGTWNATAISTQYGGTGQDFSATTQGNIPYFSDTGTISTLSPGTSGQALLSGGAGADPTWGQVTSAAGPTLIVAASNSLDTDRADYVADGAGGTDDAVTIETAIAALPSGGGTVKLLEGTYYIGSSVDITKSNVSLVGSGKSTILQRAADAFAMITVGDGGTTAVEGMVISDLSIDGVKATYTSTINHGIYFNQKITQSRIENSLINNCSGSGVRFISSTTDITKINSYNIISHNELKNNNVGIDFRVSSYDTSNRNTYNTISENIIRNTVTNAISLRSSSNNIISNNTIYDWGNSTLYGGIYLISGSNNNFISSNLLWEDYSSAKGIYISNSTCNSNYLIGNEISGGCTEINDAGTGTTIQHRDQFEIEASTTTTALTITQSSTGDILNILDGATEIFTILDGGNVGIGTATPEQTLSITGDFSISAPSTTAASLTQTSSADFSAGTTSQTGTSGTGNAASVILAGDTSGGVSWTHVSAYWLPADVGQYASPAFADIDNDGDYDLAVGEKYGDVEYFRNDGTASSPSWTHVSTDWLLADVGTAAKPTFADIDNDGDYDLAVGDQDGYVEYFRNDGTASSPTWTSVSTDWLPADVGQYASPAFADIDNDGDYDLAVGNSSGYVSYFRNDGTASSHTWTHVSANWLSADVGGYANPAFADIDNDGDYDLAVGDFDGYVEYFRNDGTASVPSWTSVSTNWLPADVGGWAAPSFADIDNDGDYDLAVGDFDGKVEYFRNDSPYYSSGDFTSSALDSHQSPDYTTLTWNSTVPANTELKFQLRSATTEAGLTSATWYGPTGTGDYYTSSGTAINSTHDTGRWIQYKAYLSNTDTSVTPSLDDITINYTYYSKLYADSSGNLGIGVAPTTALDVGGNFQVNSSGQVTSGIWNGTAVDTVYGGTGLTAYTIGDMLYANTTTSLTKLNIGTANYILTSDGTSPQWSSSLIDSQIADILTISSSGAVDAASIKSGTLLSARLTGAYTGITGLGTLTTATSIDVTDNTNPALTVTQSGTGDIINLKDSSSTKLALDSSGNLTLTEGNLTTAYGGFGRYENYLTYSEELNNAAWTATGLSITADQTASPYGTTTADQITDDVTPGGTLKQTETEADATETWTFSIWIKDNDTTGDISIEIEDNDSGSTSLTIDPPSEWQRYSISHTGAASATEMYAVINHDSTASNSFYAWGAQLEEQTEEGVYIRTIASEFSTTTRGSVGTPAGPTIIVAAANSKNVTRADYACDGAGGTDDAVTIETAIAALPSGGGTIKLLEGTYYIGDVASDGIDITKSNVSIIGSGKSTILQRTWDTASNDGVITVGDGGTTSVSGVVISDLAIDGQKGTYAGTENIGIYFNYKVSQSKIQNNWVYDCDGTGILFSGDPGKENNYNIIQGNDVSGNDDDGLGLMYKAHSNVISGNNFQSNGDKGIYIDISSNNIISNNNIQSNSSDGIYFNGGGGFESTDNIISDNNIQLNGDDGIYFRYSDYNIISENNIQSNTDEGIVLENGSSNNTISGNNLRSNGGIAIFISDNSIHNNIFGNMIYDVGPSSYYDGGICIYSDNNIISSNFIYDASGDVDGINIIGGVANNYLIGNEIMGNWTAEVSDGGTGTTIQHRDQFEIEASTTTTALTVTQSSTGDILNILDGSTEVFTILDGGNIGIGTSTPQDTLDIRGDILSPIQDTVADCDGSATTTAGTCDTTSDGTALISIGDNTIDFDNNAAADTVYLCTDSLTSPAHIRIDLNQDCTDNAGTDGTYILGSAAATVKVTSAWAFKDDDADSLLDNGEDLYIDKIPTTQYFSSGTGNAIFGGDVYAGTRSGGAIDVAEWIKVGDLNIDDQGKTTLEPGDIICTDREDSNKVIACQNSYDNNIISVVSTNPHLTMGEEYKGEDAVRMVLTGRVSVKVSSENGPIETGDQLTSSSIPGIAMKATKPGRIIGTALESFELGDTPAQSPPYEGGEEEEFNKIMTFIDPGFSLGSLNSDGLLEISEMDNNENNEDSENNNNEENEEQLTVLDQFTLSIKGALNKLGLIVENGVARVKELVTDKITTNELCIQENGEEVCIDKNKLKELLEKIQIPASSSAPALSPVTPIPDAPIWEHLTEENCSLNGGHWYDNTCNAEAETPPAPSRNESGTGSYQGENASDPICDSDNLDLCSTEDLCDGIGLHWYGGVCNLEAEIVSDSNKSDSGSDGSGDKQDIDVGRDPLAEE